LLPDFLANKDIQKKQRHARMYASYLKQSIAVARRNDTPPPIAIRRRNIEGAIT